MINKNDYTSIKETPPGFLKRWWIGARPFSFSASLVPVLLGNVIAAYEAGVKIDLWILFLSEVAITLLHGAANILNDAYDYKKGLDVHVIPVSGSVVRKYISPRDAIIGSFILFIGGSLIGIIIASLTSWLIIPIGITGIAIGVFYSATRIGLKYRALGDLSVFIPFGVLGTLGAYVTQTKVLSFLPVLWSIPVSLHIVAILHANNWRDIEGDTGKNFSTVASILGDWLSLRYYALLVLVPYLLVCIFVLPQSLLNIPRLPYTSLLVFLSCPLAFSLLKKGGKRAKNESDFLTLDGATAKLNLLFGLLYAVGILIAVIQSGL